jgi:aminoglycoside phosphotransferase (APT) family kinase protein
VQETAADDLAQRLEMFLGRETGAADVAVSGLMRLAGGAVHHTWAFTAALRGGSLAGEHNLVLRIDVPGRENPASMALEYRLLVAMHAAGVPVPRPHLLGDERLDQPAFIMDRVSGETNPRRLHRDERYAAARAAFTGQLGGIIAAIHRAPLESLPLDLLRRPPDGVSPAQFELDGVEQQFRETALNPHPVFELALRWLRERAAACSPPNRDLALVHGDFRVGNLLFDESGVRAVLDWEGAHLGDPMEDLGWLCVRAWRFGNDRLPVGGTGTREALIAAYEAAGLPVDREALRFWEVYGNLRWGVITRWQAWQHVSGAARSQELAAIGRRTAETELELLELIGQE